MKSKSFDVKSKTPEKVKQNKTFDFTSYYRTAAETNAVVVNAKSAENLKKEGENTSKKNNGTPKMEKSPNKKKKHLEPVDISLISIDGHNLDTSAARSTPLNESKVTSTPQTANKTSGQVKVKSIMRNKSFVNSEDVMDDSQLHYSPGKPKKRNKSVSFMLDENEEIVIKKTKSNDTIKIDKKPDSPKKSETSNMFVSDKKLKRKKPGKENKLIGNVTAETNNAEENIATETKPETKNEKTIGNDVKRDSKDNLFKKKKFKKAKKQESESNSKPTDNESNNNVDQTENKNKKIKKKKHSLKPQTSESDADGEPALKSRKKQVKPEVIVENLEKMSIGDNAHTLTNLLDEMTVAEKDKRKKHKRKLKKDKKVLPSTSNNDEKTEETDKSENDEGKEKTKWKKRKWNKDKKGDVDGEAMQTSIIVANLPLSTILTYKKLLADHFGKYGLIKKIGVAEVYPTEDSKPIFTTTINFYSEGAASEALAEDGSSVSGARIHVRRAPAPAQSTLVVRSYAALDEQALSSAFLRAGRIRNIRLLVKGKKAIATAFIEFDGPETVEKALALARDVKIAGKKVHASKFENRKKNKVKTPKNTAESDNEGDSEDSND